GQSGIGAERDAAPDRTHRQERLKPMSAGGAARERLRQWFGDEPHDIVLRTLFVVMLVTTATLLAVDFNDLSLGSSAAPTTSRAVPFAPLDTPAALPAMRRDGRDAPPLPRFDDKLRAPMTFDLGADGRLFATGTIVPGTAAVFAAEVAKRGGYV